MFHSFFQLSSKVLVLISLFAFFQLYSVVSRDSQVHYPASSFIIFVVVVVVDYLTVWSSGQDYVIPLYLKIPKKVVITFSRTDSELCIYHLFVLSNFNFLHNFLWITFPTQSCIVLYSYYYLFSFESFSHRRLSLLLLLLFFIIKTFK